MNPFTATLQVVWGNPTCVWLDPRAIARLGERLSAEEFGAPEWRDPVFPEDDLAFVDFIALGNSVNFAFTDFGTGESFSVTYQGRVWRGAFAMWACLRRALDSGLDVLSGDFLRRLSRADVEKLFSGDSPMPLLGERHAILKEVGAILCERFRGQFRNLVLACNQRAFGEGGLVTQLLEFFPSFRDESLHRKSGTLLKFEKRAQLLAMMYQGRALSSKGLPTLADADDVGPIADYSVPRALNAAGVLLYSPDLALRIAEGIPIARHSVEEQEIRAQTVRAQIELLNTMSCLAKHRSNFICLDYWLWTWGRAVDAPHHLTITTAY